MENVPKSLRGNSGEEFALELPEKENFKLKEI